MRDALRVSRGAGEAAHGGVVERGRGGERRHCRGAVRREAGRRRDDRVSRVGASISTSLEPRAGDAARRGLLRRMPHSGGRRCRQPRLWRPHTRDHKERARMMRSWGAARRRGAERGRASRRWALSKRAREPRPRPGPPRGQCPACAPSHTRGRATAARSGRATAARRAKLPVARCTASPRHVRAHDQRSRARGPLPAPARASLAPHMPSSASELRGAGHCAGPCSRLPLPPPPPPPAPPVKRP